MTFLEDLVYKCFGCFKTHVLCHQCGIMVQKEMSFEYMHQYYCSDCVPEEYFTGDKINLMTDNKVTGRYQ